MMFYVYIYYMTHNKYASRLSCITVTIDYERYLLTILFYIAYDKCQNLSLKQ